MRGALREQDLEEALPQPCFAPATVMGHDGFPRPEVFGHLPPGRGRPGHPEHCLHAPAPLRCCATSLELRRLEQWAQLVPEGKSRAEEAQATGWEAAVCAAGDGRGETAAALGVKPLRAGLMCAAETRPPHEMRPLLLCRLDPSQEAAHFCQAQLETGGLTSAFFSRAWWRTTASTA